jgi:cytochrome oxidase Cu insertion factor (SCO1/SenC/PrrC family)
MVAGAAELLHKPFASTPAFHWFDSQRPDARDYFSDLELQAHDGRPVRFFSDLLENRTVLINVVATQCRGICKTTTHRLAVARDALGDRFGKDIFFVSVTSDPARDTVPVLRQFSHEHGVATPGWTFVTGPRAHLEYVLKQLGQRMMSEHAQFGQFTLGNVPSSRWQRLKADVAPRTVAERLRDLADQRRAT